jgi:pectate lyase
MVDTDYLEDLSGFSNGPTSDIQIDATYAPSNDNGQPNVFFSGEPWLAANLTNASIKITNVALRLSGSDSISVQGSGTGWLSISRSRNVTINGGSYTDVKLDGDGSSGIIPSDNISLNNLTLEQIPTNSPSDPAWVEIYDTNHVSLNNVTVDLTEAPAATFFPLIQFKDVDGLTIQNLKVRCVANQTGLQLWAAGTVSNFDAVGGSYTLPVPFPEVVLSGQTGTTSCPTT